jgi:N-acetylglucosamine kinase-like BadF-type ATPase
MSKGIFSIGVDLGGTYMRVCAAGEDRKPLKSFKAPAPFLHDLVASLKSLWKTWRVARPEHLVLASKGVWSPADRKSLERQLKPLAKNVAVISDVELAFESAFTKPKDRPGSANGVLILAGTGSIAFGRDPQGLAARAGGLGPSLGDEGSGFWIGKEYMRLIAVSRTQNAWVKDLVRSQDSVARIAALSKTVLAKAKKDKACANIVHMAQTHLSELVMSLVQKLRFAGPIPLTWSGGLFVNAWFRKGFWDVLTHLNPKIKFVAVPPRQDPSRAAAAWAGWVVSDPVKPFGYAVPAGRE